MKTLMAILVTMTLSCSAGADTAERVLEHSGIKGGLVVVLGCDDPELLSRLGASDAFLVEGLDTDAEKIRRARESIKSKGPYGRISANAFDGTNLPYVDDLANLIVVQHGKGQETSEEFARVLCPGGMLMVHDPEFRIPAMLASRPLPLDGWQAAVKPVPGEIDEWTHFLCQPNNNAVSKDSVVGPVNGLKWTCGPLWSRSHEFTSSLSILVSAGGRVFYIVDEGPTSITTPEIPERWVLIARDAFNGKELWRMPLPEWRSRLGRNTALRSVPPTAQRCLVAGKDRVLVSSPLAAAVKAVDAATGETLTTYVAAEGAREFVKIGASLVLYQEKDGDNGRGRIARLDLETGKLLWSSPNDRYKGESLAASEKYVIYHNGQTPVCLSLSDGKERWRGEQPPAANQRRTGRSAQATYIIYENLVLEGSANLITARRAETGNVIWQARTGGNAMRGHDCFVARGCVWHAAGDEIVGYDLETGEPAITVDPTNVESPGHHLRCYRAKATDNYLITQFRGVEFVSITGGEHSQSDWTRGACSFGVVPANGLLYVPPNPCFCYPGVKIPGLNALVGKPIKSTKKSDQKTPRLQRGPAFGKVGIRNSELGTEDPKNTSSIPQSAFRNPHSHDWPTYRHDPMRHGATECSVPENVTIQWKTALPGKLSPPVSACGNLYVAAKERHTVYALDARTGKTTWAFTAGARIDSPPTIYDSSKQDNHHRPLCIFGSADGHVYCLTADQGELVWRFRAAPSDRRIMAFDQLESVWPVHGSVLVKKDVVYCTAGRSSMLDGGVWLYGLNPRTGEVMVESNVDTLSKVRDDVQEQPLIPSYVMDGAHADVLVSEGDVIYMGAMMFDLELNRQKTPYIMGSEQSPVAMDISRADYITVDAELQKEGYETYRSFHRYQERAWPEMTEEFKSRYGGFNLGDTKMGPHVTPTAGFLDDTWFNRTYWMYSDKWPGWYHAHRGAKTGQLLVVGRDRTYALQAFPERNRQSPLFTPGAKGYLLVADANDNEPVLDYKTRGATKGLGYTRMKPPVWHDWVPIRVRGMVEAGDLLFVAGVPDVVPEDDPSAALDGRRGALLRAVSAADGTILSERILDAPPVFDGLIAAADCLFVCTEDHRVVCLSGSTEAPSAEERAALARLRAEQAARRKQDKEAAQSRRFGRAATPKQTDAPTGKRLPTDGTLPRDDWRIVQASSVEASRTGFAPEKMLDGDPMTSWHSKWASSRDPFPHEIVVDLGAEVVCRGLHYLPRQDRAQNGRIKEVALYISKNASDWGQPVAQGTWQNTLDEQRLSFDPVAARYVRLVVESGYDQDLSAIAELNVLGDGPQP